MVDMPPPGAIDPLAKSQVTSPVALAQVQLVPLAETNRSEAGSASRTCAVGAAAVPVLVTVIV